MADQLGQAVLELTADINPLLDKLRQARNAAENFTPDFKGVERSLRGVTTEAQAAATQVRSLNQVLSTAPGASFDKITSQIKRLREESNQLKFSSDEYLKTLQRIRELEFTRNARSGRQQANAGAAAFNDATLTRGFGAPDRLPSLPNTIAGDQQLITELTQRLQNLDRNSGAYGTTLRQLEAAQQRVRDAMRGTSDVMRQLQADEERAIRRTEKLASIQQYYADLNPRAGGVRNESGAMVARGANSAADERAYRASLRPSQELLENDLRREQTLRRINQLLQGGGFGAASANNFRGGTTDPVEKSIRRNAERVAQREGATNYANQQAQLDRDLTAVRNRRLREEQKAAAAAAKSAAAEQRAAALAQERARADRQRRTRDAVGSALIGGAFPALFGQGLGASVGGAVGGGFGGALGGQFGFGLSLVGTALGTAFDTAIRNAQTLAKALEAPIENFDALRESALLSSRAVEKQVQALIESGRTAEAAALIQRDISSNFTDPAEAKRLADASDQLTRSWGRLSISIAQLTIPTVADSVSNLALALQGLQQIIENVRSVIPEGLPTPPRGTERGAAFFNPLSGGFGTAAVLEFLKVFGGDKNQKQQQREQQAQIDYEKRVAEATRQTSAARSASYRLITAQVQGNRDAVLQAQKELILNERNLKLLELRARLGKLAANDPRVQRINEDAAKELFRLQEELNRRPAAGSFGRLREELQVYQEELERTAVGTQEFIDISFSVTLLTTKLRELEGVAAQIKFDQLTDMLDAGGVALSFGNLNDKLQEADKVLQSFNFARVLSTADPALNKVVSQITKTRDEIRQLDRLKAEVEIRVIGDQIANGQIARSFSNLKDQLQAAQTVVENFDFSRLNDRSSNNPEAQLLKRLQALRDNNVLQVDLPQTPFVQTIQNLTKIQDQITQLNGRKAQVTVEVIRSGIERGALTDNIANLQELQNNARAAFEAAPLGSAEQIRAAEQYTKAGERLEKASEALNQTPQRLIDAADRLRESLRSTLQGNLSLIPREQRQQLREAAIRDVQRGRDAGILRPDFNPRSTRRLFEGADFVRNIERQQQDASKLLSSQEQLIQALNNNTTAERNIRIVATIDGAGAINIEQQAALR